MGSSHDAMGSPLLVVGAARSGTTLVGRMLASHDDVVYWPEPAFVWRYGNAYRLHDALVEDHCRPGIRRRIRSAFRRKAAEGPGAVLVEKTPGNSYRMPFVLAALPEARVLHVLRDGRQVARSAREEWHGRGASALDSADLRRLGVLRRLALLVARDLRLKERYVGPMSLLELPAYVPRTLGVLLRQTLHVSWMPWGPRFPGIIRARWRHGPLGVAALQWQRSVRSTRAACGGLGPDRYREIAFESLMERPESTLAEMREFAGLAEDPSWMARCKDILKPRAVKRDAGLTPDEVRHVETLVGETLVEAGYARLAEPSTSPRREAAGD